MKAQSGEVLFEHVQIGTIVRVTAIDAATGTEVVIQGPANIGTAALQRTAMAKLEYVLKKQQAENR
jgi:hypothetical protein